MEAEEGADPEAAVTLKIDSPALQPLVYYSKWGGVLDSLAPEFLYFPHVSVRDVEELGPVAQRTS